MIDETVNGMVSTVDILLKEADEAVFDAGLKELVREYEQLKVLVAGADTVEVQRIDLPEYDKVLFFNEKEIYQAKLLSKLFAVEEALEDLEM